MEEINLENNQYNQKEYKSFSEILGDSFRVLKENFLTYFVVFIIVAILGGAVSGMEYTVLNSGLLSNLISIVNLLVASVVSILYVGTTYNTLCPNKKRSIGDLMGSYIVPMILTQLLFFVILFMPLFIVLMALMFGLMLTDGFGMMMPIMIIFIILIAGCSVKFVFLPQAVVLSEQKYWQAIKWSWKKTSGHVGMIIGIGLTPAVLGIVIFFLMQADMMNLMTITIFSLLSSIIGIVVTLAISVLYIDVVLEEDDNDSDEILIYGGDF
jgi:hypothetical protein